MTIQPCSTPTPPPQKKKSLLPKKTTTNYYNQLLAYQNTCDNLCHFIAALFDLIIHYFTILFICW